MNVIFLGSPGSGKGTQSSLLKERLGVVAISSGQMLREAARSQTDLGKKAESYISVGRLVPDNMMIKIMQERLNREDCKKGFILDGFPRTLNQASALSVFLSSQKKKVDAVVNFVVDQNEILNRLGGRRECEKCGKEYHVLFLPPKESGVCDKCGGSLIQRDDDKETTIARRLKIYEEQTKPLIDFYKNEGVLKDINALGGKEEVFSRIKGSLGN